MWIQGPLGEPLNGAACGPLVGCFNRSFSRRTRWTQSSSFAHNICAKAHFKLTVCIRPECEHEQQRDQSLMARHHLRKGTVHPNTRAQRSPGAVNCIKLQMQLPRPRRIKDNPHASLEGTFWVCFYLSTCLRPGKRGTGEERTGGGVSSCARFPRRVSASFSQVSPHGPNTK